MTPLTTAPTADVRLAIVLMALLLLATATSLVARLGADREQVVAAVRAVVQLTAVAAVLVAVLESVVWSIGFVLLMYVVASITAGRRLQVRLRSFGWVALAVAAGAGPVVALTFASGVVPAEGAAIIPIAGIVIGNAMTVVGLAGRRAFDALAGRWGEVEAGFAIGLPERQARDLVVRPTAREALLPAIDQTRTVGLVTLPGAFIGVILGGGTPVQASAAQVLVLFGVIAAQAVTAAVVLWAITSGLLTRDHDRRGRR